MTTVSNPYGLWFNNSKGTASYPNTTEISSSSPDIALLVEVYIYRAVLVPLSVLGTVTNTLLIWVFCRQTYHPTRLIIQVIAAGNMVFLVWFHVYTNVPSGDKYESVSYDIYSTLRVFILQSGTFMTAVHHFWVLYPRHHKISPFFKKRRILVCLFLIFLWSVIQSFIEEVVLKKVPQKEEEIIIKFSFQVLTLALPPLVQLGLVIRMLCIWRSRRQLGVQVMFSTARNLATAMLAVGDDNLARQIPTRNSSGTGSSRPKSAGRQVSRSNHCVTAGAFNNTLSVRNGHSNHSCKKAASRSVLMPVRMEAGLNKAVVVISTLPLLSSTLLTLVTGYFRKVARTENPRTTLGTSLIITSDLLHVLSASYQFWLFLALLPSFRLMLKLNISSIRCAFFSVAKMNIQANVTPPTTGSRVTTVSTASCVDSYSTSTSSSVDSFAFKGPQCGLTFSFEKETISSCLTDRGTYTDCSSCFAERVTITELRSYPLHTPERSTSSKLVASKPGTINTTNQDEEKWQ